MLRGNRKIWLSIAAGSALSVAAMVTTAGADDTAWNTTVRGDWGTASNWNNGVPVADSGAYLAMQDAIVDYTVTSTTMPFALVSIDNRLSLVQRGGTDFNTNTLVVGESSPADPDDPSSRSAYHLNYGANLMVNHGMVVGLAGRGQGCSTIGAAVQRLPEP